MAIDDFGTGYSSYNLLSEIKIDVLKLDKKLFNNLENERTKIIINAIIKMTKELKIESVAEGIEKKEQLEYLKKIKCDEIQGYYFSKPIPLEEFEKKIINKKNNNEK
jgi:EAL domain-containing protein (putative c-di-GMP-specific phosphodiesterase class I)